MVEKWLGGADPSPKYNQALGIRQAGTGAWLIDGNACSTWIKEPSSLLWLYGIPGCGKTVLCSTAIERVLHQRSSTTQKPAGIGYFYFEFNDQGKQSCDAMLRSLITQLSRQSSEASKPLDALYLSCGSGASQPSLAMISKALRETVESFTDVFILVDALDECRDREELLTNIEDMIESKPDSLHMLLTSRRERRIDESLSAFLGDEQRVSIQSALVEHDIRTYVQSRIRTDRKLKKWQRPEVQLEIETVLVEKAGGM